jgi:hypothetical protein
MRDLRTIKPSPALVLATAALILAGSGSAVAATRLANGDKLIKPHSLSGNRLRSHTLTAAQINIAKLGTVPTSKNSTELGGKPASAFQPAIPPLTFTPATLNSPWVEGTDAGDSTPAFAKDALGFVHLEGSLSGGAGGTAAFVLPVADRPDSIGLFPVVASGGTAKVVVEPDGEVVPVDTGSTAVTNEVQIDGVEFYAR